MKSAIIHQSNIPTVESKIHREELIRKVEQLENERVRYLVDSQEQLRRCETKYQTMLETVDAHMVLVDNNFQILWANRRAQKIFGRDCTTENTV